MENFFSFEHSGDLSLVYAGSQKCPPNHKWSQFLQNNYLLHFIISGKGVCTYGEKSYNLSAGKAFLIPPDVLCTYCADGKDPWHYFWFMFSGGLAENFLSKLGLSEKNPIYETSFPDKIYSAFTEFLNSFDRKNDFLSVGAFMNLLGVMLQCSSSPVREKVYGGDEYVQRCKDYIQLNFNKHITIDELCGITCIERSYLYRLFKQHTGVGPKDYIINYKMRRAAQLVKTTNLTVCQIAQSVGYDDTSAFSKLFRQRIGAPPKLYRKNAADESEK